MASKPTFVLVPGAWHGPETWEKVTPLLEAQGHKCIPIELPTTVSAPGATFVDDLEAARRPIVEETSQGRDVIVVVHSYGSIVGCSAVKGLTRPDEPGRGRVVGIIIMASGCLPSGIAFLDALGGVPPPLWRADAESGLAVLQGGAEGLRAAFYHDLPEEEGRLWVSRLREQSLKAFTFGGEHVYAGWQDVPVEYFATKDDRAHPYEIQLLGVQMARGMGGRIGVSEFASGHSLMLSVPQETAEAMLKVAANFGA